jgi:transposase-like protein
MTVSSGFTAAEIREFVHEYQVQPHGQKGSWLVAQGVSDNRMRRWREAVFEGDLDRGLIPREGSPVMIPPSKRTALEKERARERAAQAAEVTRLTARVRELEDTNDALGKAIGLLHAMSEHEPAEPPTTTTDPSDS